MNSANKRHPDSVPGFDPVLIRARLPRCLQPIALLSPEVLSGATAGQPAPPALNRSAAYGPAVIRDDVLIRDVVQSPEHPIGSYLRFYGLDHLLHRADYQAACLVLAHSELVVQQFTPHGPVRGTLVLVHGYMDHAALQRNLVQQLLAGGWAVVIYDLPGHGLSAGEPLAIDSFFHYADQLAELLALPACRVGGAPHLIGHSTGAAIITTLLLRAPQLRVGRTVLLAPLLRPRHWRLIRLQYQGLRWLLRRVKRQWQDNTHDAGFMTFLRCQDPLQHRFIPVRWVGAMLNWIRWVERQSGIAVRPLIIQGTADRTVAWRGNLQQLAALYHEPEVVLIDAARHNLVNEAPQWREQVFAALLRGLPEAD